MAGVGPADEDVVKRVMREVGAATVDAIPSTLASLTADAVRAKADAAGLLLDDALIMNAVAAIRAGKHLMLRGAPGTGKTTFAIALCDAAAEVGLTDEPMLSTATADWTSVDTVGAYRMRRDNLLEFREGHVLSAIREDRWLVIDELNRADIDKAIGQLFTVLSGHPVTLPFEVDAASEAWADAHADGDSDGEEDTESGQAGLGEIPRLVSIVPAGTAAPIETVPVEVPPAWRLIATLNIRDQDLLFTMSEALQRRFAIIDMDTPNEAQWTALLDAYGRTGKGALDAAVDRLVTGDYFGARPLGPALILDAVRHMERLLDVAEDDEQALTDEQVLESALALYVRPHMVTYEGATESLSPTDLLPGDDEGEA